MDNIEPNAVVISCEEELEYGKGAFLGMIMMKCELWEEMRLL
jgi:hypothetical protein